MIVGVGGFFGVGERYARLHWKDLQVSDNGERVVVNMTKDQLKAMAPYKYKEDAMRGKVFSDRGVWKDDSRTATTGTAAATNTIARRPTTVRLARQLATSTPRAKFRPTL